MFKNKPVIRILIAVVTGLAVGTLFEVWATQRVPILFAFDGQSGRVQWTTRLRGYEAGNPVVANQRIFVDSITDYIQVGNHDFSYHWDLVALEAETGRQLWRTTHEPLSYNAAINRYAPMATADFVIDDINHDTLGVYDAETGQLLYQIEDVAAWGELIQGGLVWGLTTDVALPVALAEDRLILRHQLKGESGLITDAVQAYDLDSGALLWSTNYSPYTAGGGRRDTNLTPILFDNQRVYLEVSDQYQVFDINSGDFLFSLDQICIRASIQQTTLYCLYDDLKAFDATTGDLYWSFYPDDLDINLQEVDADTNTVYVTTASPFAQWLIALDPTDGSERWRVKVWDSTGDDETLWHVAPSAHEDRVFAMQIIENQKALVALSTVDGTQLWRFPLYGEYSYSPVSDGEYVYVVDIAPRWRNWIPSRR